MTEEELIKLISRKKASTVLKALADLPPIERRKHAKAVSTLYKSVISGWNDHPTGTRIRDSDAARVALLATATLSELKAMPFPPIPRDIAIEDVLRALQPDWIEGWVQALVESNPNIAAMVAPIWQAGLCPRPTTDAFILGYYTHAAWRRDAFDETELLEHDVWRFFEVEGGGEFSLASHDKYTQPNSGWNHTLLTYAAEGKLDRGRLLDASLDAMEKDFGQFRAGWYSRFHTSLEPTMDEMTARAGRYLTLLSSTVPPTVSCAMKLVQALDKSGKVDGPDLLVALEAPLQARQKGTVTAALRLVASVAKRNQALATDAARTATLALVSEAADVQGKALDLIEKLGGARDASVQTALQDYVDMAAPSVRQRLAALAGAELNAPVEVTQTFAPAKAVLIKPVANATETLALFLAVLENARDPIEIERAMDGMARFGTALRADDTALSPLKKRALQLWKAQSDSEIKFALAATGRGFAEGRSIDELRSSDNPNPAYELLSPDMLSRVFLDRNAELIAQVLNGDALPMISMPSDSSGCITPADLIARITLFRSAGVRPGKTDLALALLRLSQNGRLEALGAFAPEGEVEQAVAYAMGADYAPGQNAALWAAAWAARQPTQADAAVAALFTPPLPDCGVPAASELYVGIRENGSYRWEVVEAPVDIDEHTNTNGALPAMFYPFQENNYWNRAICREMFEDVAWGSLVRTQWQEPFFRQAVLSMETSQKLSDHYCCAYLEPFFRPGPKLGPFGAATLAYYMASEDKAVTALTAEATTLLFNEGRLNAVDLAKAAKPFLMCEAMPTSRWTKTFSAIADAGAGGFVREVIGLLLDFAPDDAPRDMGGMLELLYELHVSSNTAPERPEAIACLTAMTGGGKVAKFSKKLVQMAG